MEFLGEVMHDWKSLLNDDPIDWLLEKNDPSVRFFALTELLEKPSTILR